MRLLVCLVLPLVAWCAPAVPQDNSILSPDSLKPLIRTKRADEEIVFGNHQNTAQVVKKSDPSLRLAHDEAGIDKKATITANHDINPLSDDVMEQANDGQDENEAEENEAEEEVGGEADDNSVWNGEDQPEGNEGNELETTNSESDKENFPKDENWSYYDYYSPYRGMYRSRRSFPKVEQVKRSVPEAKMMTAETMDTAPAGVVSGTGSRVKRDLTADDINRWLDTGVDPRDPYIVEYDDPWQGNSAIEALLDKQYPDYTDDSENLVMDYPEYNSMEEKDLTGSDDNNKADNLLSLLEYLVESEETPEVAYDPIDSSNTGDLYPGDVSEEWEDFDLGDVEYEPIVYNGVPGIFIPMSQAQSQQQAVPDKRQYLSLVPGIRKRSDFYPYNMEPEGGRWGAFVDGEQEKRDAAEAYNRLFRMAEALNQPQDVYPDYQ